MVVKDGVVPLVPRGQQHLALLDHPPDVQPLRGAVPRLAERPQQPEQRRHVDKRVVVRLEHERDVEVLDRVLEDEVGLVEDRLVVGALLDVDDVAKLGLLARDLRRRLVGREDKLGDDGRRVVAARGPGLADGQPAVAVAAAGEDLELVSVTLFIIS